MDEPRRQSELRDPLAGGSTASALGGSDEQWLERVRVARQAPALGPLGSYELIEVVAQGGQGVVYRAVQANTKRPVALKRLLTGSVADGTARARFEREIEVDAALKHPNIVGIYGVEFVCDQPILVMEWIDGAPIDAWAAEKPRDAILRVFLKICDAVQHGHQRGVIHRDLKPSNILVDAADEPHVLDFGLAKLIGDRADARSRLTLSSGFVGTLAYSSPEQVRCDPDAVDVRTDIYALGCVLYRCLTGHAPFEQDGDLEVLIQRICHADAARASSVDSALAGDLDAILDKALAKDRERRYPTVEAFGADVRRHLAHEPVLARPPSVVYQLRRFARRHRTLVAGAATLVVVLAAATTVSTVLYLRAARDRALSSAVYEFMHQVLTSVDVRKGVTLEEAIDRAAHEVEGAFTGRPMVEADVRDMIRAMYERLGLYEKARAQQEARLPLLERELGADAEKTLDAAISIGWMLYREHRFAEGVPWLRRASTGFTRTLGPDHAKTLQATSDLGLCLNEAGQTEEAETLHRTALAISERTRGPEDEWTTSFMNNLALAIMSQEEKRDEAAALFRRVLAAQERADHPDEANTAITMYNLARLLDWDSDPPECERLLRGASDRARRVFRDGHPLTVQFDTHLGEFFTYHGRLDEAEPVLRETLAAAREHLGDDERPTMHAQLTLGGLLTKRGRFQDAEDLILPAYEWCSQALGAQSDLALAAIDWLIKLYDAWGKPDKAAEYRALLETDAPAPPP